MGMRFRTSGQAGVGLAAVALLAVACGPAAKARVDLPAPAQSALNAPAGGAPADGFETAIGKIRHLSATAHPAVKHVSGRTVENSDPRLAAALLTLATLPTADSYRLVAREYERLRITDAAYEHFRRAVQANPRDAAAHAGLARCWRDWGLPALAIGDAQRAVYYAPQSAEALNTLGTILHAAGNRRAAGAAYLRALALDANAAYALNNLCYVEFLEGRIASATTYCERAIASDPTLSAARRNLALVHASAGRLDLAWSELQQADAPAEASYNLGIINLARRELGEALDAFTAACRANSIDACRRATQLRLQRASAEDEP